MIIDAHLFQCLEERTSKRIFLENISHSIVLIAAMLLALVSYHYLDKLLAIIGCFYGLTVVLIIPSICHYKLIACDPIDGSLRMRITDMGITVYAFTCMFLVSIMLIANWHDKS
jgi:amino acid permease